MIGGQPNFHVHLDDGRPVQAVTSTQGRYTYQEEMIVMVDFGSFEVTHIVSLFWPDRKARLSNS
jgi:hypothetical protein